MLKEPFKSTSPVLKWSSSNPTLSPRNYIHILLIYFFSYILYSKVIEKIMFPGNQSATFTYCAQVIKVTSRYCMQEQFYTRAGKQMKV